MYSPPPSDGINEFQLVIRLSLCQGKPFPETPKGVRLSFHFIHTAVPGVVIDERKTYREPPIEFFFTGP